MKRLLAGLAAFAAAAVVAAPAMADGNSLGPPGGTFYANGQAFKSIITPTSIPNKGPFDTLYMIAGFAPVSDAAPGDQDYNGGRWRVVLVEGSYTSQPKTEGEVLAGATSVTPTETRFVCPLIPA